MKRVAKRSIPFFDYPAMFSEIEAEILPVIHDVLRKGAFIMQSDLANFESELADYAGVEHVIGVGDGTMALLLPLLAMKLRPGDEVIVPSHTFIASAAAIHHAGGTPILVDCGKDHLIDNDSVRDALTGRTRGIMPVQLNGRTAAMDGIEKIASEHGLFIVEDSCQALGSRYKGRAAGTFGSAGAISFYPSKTLGAFGDGGAVITNDDAMADAVRSLRDHGRTESGNVSGWGFNSRLDNLQAAILRIRLRQYDDYVRHRRRLAAIYDERLSGLDQLDLPPGPDSSSEHFDIYQNYEIEAERRDDLRRYLAESGVGTILQWGGTAIHQFRNLGFDVSLPYTESMVERFMLLPMNTAVTEDDVNYVCDRILDFYSAH